MEVLEVVLLVVSLLVIIPFGIITSLQDIKKNKVRNKWILITLILAVLINIGVMIYMSYTNHMATMFFVKQFFLNILFAFIVGFLIWEGSLWSAGDAKLFLAYAAITPLFVYKWGYVNSFPSYVILINTFTPYFLYYFAHMVVNTSWKDKLEVTKDLFKPRFMISIIIFIFGLSWPVQLILQWFNIQANLFLSVVLLLALMIPLSKIHKNGLMISGAVLSILRLIFDYSSILTFGFLKSFLSMIFLFVFVRYFVVILGFKMFAKPVYIEDLKPGMLLAEDIIKVKVKGKESYQKKPMISISFISPLFNKAVEESIIHNMPEGLTKKDIKLINKLHSEGKFKAHLIGIYHSMPFAPFMFAGVLITIIIQGNVLMVVRYILENFI